MSTVAVRPALPQDEIFMYELYSAIRSLEFACMPVTPDQREHLIRMQFQGQLAAYTQAYPNSCYHIVLLDGKPVGRLWVSQTQGEFHLVDIGLHPEQQRKGIGSALIQRLQQEAAALGLSITSTVSRFNPGSFQFHQSLGFRVVRQDQLNHFMQWQPVPLFR